LNGLKSEHDVVQSHWFVAFGVINFNDSHLGLSGASPHIKKMHRILHEKLPSIPGDIPMDVPNTSPFSGQTPQFFGNCQSNEAGVFLKGPE